MRTMQATTPAESLADCPFSIAHEYAAEYFRRAQNAAVWPGLLRRRVRLSFGFNADDTEAGRLHDEIRLRWSTGTPFVPDIHGTVRLRIAGSGTRVFVYGGYEAQTGPFGRVYDWFLGAEIARASASDLAARIAAYLEARQREWRACLTSPSC